VPQFGVDPELFSPGPGDSHASFNVGFLNRLVPAKAPLLMVQAFATLPNDSRLYVVGDGPLRERLQELIKRGDLGTRVTLNRRVPSEQMPALLKTLDVVVLPSVTTRSWKEQFGRILIEAMSCGVPVIGSDSGEIPNVVGDAGLIVPEGEVDALALALKRLYDDATLRKKLGERGRHHVLSNHTHARIARVTADAYQQAIKF
jgi:glycosyltransferase involved in cell wall biosynthesis